MTATLTIHPAAAAFPMMTRDELNALAVDIAANGQREAIKVTADGQIVDGRNRFEACRLVKIEPLVELFDDDPWTYSRSVNLWRRNMTTGQRAASCAISLASEGKRSDGRWAYGSVPDADDENNGSVTSGWQQRMKEAGFILDWLPELLYDVRDGDIALDAAYKKAKDRKAQVEWEAEEAARAEERARSANNAELARCISVMHTLINIDWRLVEQSDDADTQATAKQVAATLESKITKLKGMWA